MRLLSAAHTDQPWRMSVSLARLGRRWPRWAGYAAAGWGLLYGLTLFGVAATGHTQRGSEVREDLPPA